MTFCTISHLKDIKQIIARAYEFLFYNNYMDLTSSRITSLSVSWKAPISSFLMLNVDGYVKPNPGPGGIRRVFRNSKGSWIWGIYKHVKHASSLMVEILAVKLGLIIAIEKWISHLIIESDSETTMGLLNDNRNEKPSFLIDDCRSSNGEDTTGKIELHLQGRQSGSRSTSING